MTDEKEMLLEDALKTAISANLKIIRLKKIIVLLLAIIILLVMGCLWGAT